MQNLIDTLVRADGSEEVTAVARVTSYGRPALLELQAFAEYGFSPPPTSVRAVLETHLAGDWQEVVDFDELHDDVVERNYDWDGTSALRVSWEFAQEDSRFWIVVVRLV